MQSNDRLAAWKVMFITNFVINKSSALWLMVCNSNMYILEL